MKRRTFLASVLALPLAALPPTRINNYPWMFSKGWMTGSIKEFIVTPNLTDPSNWYLIVPAGLEQEALAIVSGATRYDYDSSKYK